MNAKLEVSADEVIAIVKNHLLNQFATSGINVGEGTAIVTDDGYENWSLDGISFVLNVPGPK